MQGKVFQTVCDHLGLVKEYWDSALVYCDTVTMPSMLLDTLV